MKLTLVQKVLISIVSLFVATSVILSVIVSMQIKQTYLDEQKRNVVDFARKQVQQHLTLADFQSTDFSPTSPTTTRFKAYQDEILTPEIVRIKIYNTKGIVLYSDQKDLIGQYLFAEEPEELQEILEGNIVAEIAKPDKKENIYEKQYKQLLEIYTPIYFGNSTVVGIVETYYNLDLLNNDILLSQIFLVVSIALIFLILFVLLFLIVQRASRTIIEQDKQLQEDILKEREYSSLKDEFIRMSSHQLRTPATAIKWSVEALNDESIGKINEKQNTLLQSILSNTNTLISIVNNLITAAHIKPDYFVFEKDGYSLYDVTQEIVKARAEEIEKKKITVTIAPNSGITMIHPKKEAIETVVHFLVDNAVDYTADGGTVSISIVQKEKMQYFEIKDSGIGIPDKDKEKIFDKLFRASNSIDKKNAGSGLSLFIAKRIIEGFGGKI
ncbi:MAG TPA: HAMP domain-containing sensor histidine kinase, partial [Patescibacteria group bacterium]|nr:HAMP domain-containing sensor histidine kinase [Patescibacteria group bacterium]